MTKSLLLLLSAGILSATALAQDTLFTENFESASSSFTLNTADVSSTTTGYNQWIINNIYAGGAGSVTCLGIPFTFTVPATPSQPAGIYNAPASTYMHIRSNEAFNSGVNNCCFQTADAFCFNVENYFTAMNTDINTLNYDSVNVNFWWICDGSNNNYGEIYYSTDSGVNWTQASVPLPKFYNQSTWTSINVSLPAFAHQSTLRFGFRFVNKTSMNASDPAFGIDDISITATTFTGIHNPTSSSNQLTVYPNVATEYISVCNAGKNAVIIDMNGKAVMGVSSGKNCAHTDISQLSQGVYAVRTAEGNVKRFIKK
jgi:hypothetical protein